MLKTCQELFPICVLEAWQLGQLLTVIPYTARNRTLFSSFVVDVVVTGLDSTLANPISKKRVLTLLVWWIVEAARGPNKLANERNESGFCELCVRVHDLPMHGKMFWFWWSRLTILRAVKIRFRRDFLKSCQNIKKVASFCCQQCLQNPEKTKFAVLRLQKIWVFI